MSSQVEAYRYLWDGSEEGWVLRHIDHAVWDVVIAHR